MEVIHCLFSQKFRVDQTYELISGSLKAQAFLQPSGGIGRITRAPEHFLVPGQV